MSSLSAREESDCRCTWCPIKKEPVRLNTPGVFACAGRDLYESDPVYSGFIAYARVVFNELFFNAWNRFFSFLGMFLRFVSPTLNSYEIQTNGLASPTLCLLSRFLSRQARQFA